MREIVKMNEILEKNMAPMIALWSLALDSLSLGYFYSTYKRKYAELDILKNTTIYESSKQLESYFINKGSETINYVGIIGNVDADGKLLQSKFSEGERGVLHHSKLIEHREEFKRGIWMHVCNIIRNRFTVIPFSLKNKDMIVDIKEPLKAEFLKRNLTLTHDSYEPVENDLMTVGMNHLMGIVTKGFEETEKILHNKERLLAYGSLIMESDGRLCLFPPNDSNLPSYIITTKSRSEVLSIVEHSCHELKMVCYGLAATALGIVGYLVWHYSKVRRNNRLISDMLAEVNQMARDSRNHGVQYDTAECCGDVTDSQEARNLCLICLDQRRQVLFVNCRHICVCADCFQSLSEPRACIVCRKPVDEFLLIYLP